MGRPMRIQFPRVVYHISRTAIQMENIFLDEDDRVNFLRILSSISNATSHTQTLWGSWGTCDNLGGLTTVRDMVPYVI